MVCGVPQGSILGPMLFYADDTVLYSTNSNEAAVHANIKQNINLLFDWCNNNKLTVNIKKTKLMLFGTKTKTMLKNSKRFDVFIGNEKLQYVNNFLYLGVKLDNLFTFEPHARECCRQVSHKNFVLSKIRRYIYMNQAVTIYKCMIQPYFCYGDVFLHNISVRTNDKMQKIQNKALRLCLQRDNRANVPLLHKDSGIYVQDRRDINLLNFMYKRKSNTNLLQTQPRVMRRFEAVLFNEYVRNNKTFESCLLFQGAQKWNALSVKERNEPSFEGFKSLQKNKLKNILLAKKVI